MTFSNTSGILHARPGRGVDGFAVGLLHIASPFPLLPGNPQNASTFDFPVVYEFVEGLSPAAVMSGDPAGAAPLIAAARKLEMTGVRAIVGICGSFANFQSQLRAAVRVPVFASVMVQLPMLLAALAPPARIAAIFADRRSYTDHLLAECGIEEPERLIVADCAGLPSFHPILAGERSFDAEAFRAELLERIIVPLASEENLGAVVLQCSELGPFAADIQCVLKVPIHDGAALVRFAQTLACRKPAAGFMVNATREGLS